MPYPAQEKQQQQRQISCHPKVCQPKAQDCTTDQGEKVEGLKRLSERALNEAQRRHCKKGTQPQEAGEDTEYLDHKLQDLCEVERNECKGGTHQKHGGVGQLPVGKSQRDRWAIGILN